MYVQIASPKVQHLCFSLPRAWSHEVAKNLITCATPKSIHMWSTPFSSNHQLKYALNVNWMWIDQFGLQTGFNPVQVQTGLKLYNFQPNMKVSSSSIPEFLTFSLQIVFLIIIIINLGVLVLFKMYRKFIYRLLLYICCMDNYINQLDCLLTTIKVHACKVNK